MFSRNYLCLTIVSVVIGLASCTKIIELELPAHESKPVVNSLFCADSTFKVYIKKSISIFDTAIIYPDNALVKLYEDDVLSDTLQFADNRYISNITARIGYRYKIVVLLPGFDTVFSIGTIPDRVSIYSISHKESILVDQDRIHYSQLKFSFTDTDPGPNYYELDIIEKYWPYGAESDTIYGFTWVDNNVDPVLEDEGLLDYNPGTYIFTDRLFNESEYTMTVNYTCPNNDTDEYDVILIFNSISENYYKYKRSLAVFNWANDADIFFGAPEPVRLYSNITGGYGVFAGYSSFGYTIKIGGDR